MARFQSIQKKKPSGLTEKSHFLIDFHATWLNTGIFSRKCRQTLTGVI